MSISHQLDAVSSVKLNLLKRRYGGHNGVHGSALVFADAFDNSIESCPCTHVAVK